MTTRSYTCCLAMLLTPLFLSVTAGTAAAQATEQLPVSDGCITCHVEEDYMPENLAAWDVHLQEGLSCAGCHGGDPTSGDYDVAMSEAEGFIGIPDFEDVPAMCGSCHSDLEFMRTYQPRIRTDQVDQYRVSVHGRRLVAGDSKVANCASCHTSHAIAPASDPRSSIHALKLPGTCQTCHSDVDYMAEYGIPTNQYDRFVESVHGRKLLEEEDLGAPACNDCHGNHGAIPPEVESLQQVCGACHANNQSFFEASPMAAPFGDIELHACIECHGYHEVEDATDDMVGVGESSVCLDCHSEGEEAYDVAAAISSHLSRLSAVSDSASTRQGEVVTIGMDDVEIDFLLRQVRQSLIRARTTVHTFDENRVAEVVAEGVETARDAIRLAELQVEEHANRRLGFGLASLFITLLVVGLYLKIREVDARLPGRTEPPGTASP